MTGNLFRLSTIHMYALLFNTYMSALTVPHGLPGVACGMACPLAVWSDVQDMLNNS